MYCTAADGTKATFCEQPGAATAALSPNVLAKLWELVDPTSVAQAVLATALDGSRVLVRP